MFLFENLKLLFTNCIVYDTGNADVLWFIPGRINNERGMNMADFMIIELDERLDAGNASELKSEAAKMIETGTGTLILDLKATKFIDSIGLGALVSILKQTAQNNSKVVLAALSPQVRQIFELTRLHRLFDIYESVEEAAETDG
jgi:anti-sigma B factor antagonist